MRQHGRRVENLMSILSEEQMEASKCVKTWNLVLRSTWQHARFRNFVAPAVPTPPTSPEHSSCSGIWSGTPKNDLLKNFEFNLRE